MLFIDVLYYLFLLIGLKLDNFINIRLSILISLIIQYLSFALLYFFFKKPFISIMSMGLFHIGNAMSSLISIKNCWKYYKNKLGFINGFILSGAGFSSSILTILGEYFIINPKHKKIYENENYKTSNFEENFRLFLFIIAVIIISCGFVSFSFSCQYKEEEFNVDELTESDSCAESQDSISDYALSKRVSKQKKNSKHGLYNALYSGQNIKLICIGFFGLGKLKINNIYSKSSF